MVIATEGQEPTPSASSARPAAAAPGRQRRGSDRFTTPELRVLITGKSYSTLNWSLGGMLLRNYGNSPQVGDRLALVAAAERSPRHAQLVGRIVRIDRRRGMIAIAFEAVADGSLRTLSGFRRR